MTTAFDQMLERVAAGEPLAADAVRDLTASPDILQLGMLADAVRRRLHGDRATFVRVARRTFTAATAEPVPAAAAEVRLDGVPDSLDRAVESLAAVRALAPGCHLSALWWADVLHLAATAGSGIAQVLAAIRTAGLDSLAALPIDQIEAPDRVLHQLLSAGFTGVTLGVARPEAAHGAELWSHARVLQQQFACVRAINPLPMRAGMRATTGYQDVRAVAVARLTAPEIPTIQVDWTMYGPKLAQVALTFGADDLWGVSDSDAAPEGRRRAPLEEARRNIEAAGFVPVERDGRFSARA